MDYKKILIERLRALNEERAAIPNLIEQIETLEARFDAIRAATTDKEPVSGGTNHREDELISNICTRDMRKSDLEWTQAEVKLMESNLKALPKEERVTLERLYVNGEKKAVERLCNELGFEQAQVYRTKDRALVRLARRLYGQVKL